MEQTTRAEAVCQEFCSEVSVSQVLSGDLADMGLGDFPPSLTEEIKCLLEIKFFPDLMCRMVELGYCCIQVQRDQKKNQCTAWFVL